MRDNNSKNTKIPLFTGNKTCQMMKYSLLTLTLNQIKDKSCEMEYCLQSMRDFGIKYDGEEAKGHIMPPDLTEKEMEWFYITISMIKDHHAFILSNINSLELMGIRTDYFDRHRRKNPGIEQMFEPDGRNDGCDDSDEQGELFN